MIGLVDGIFHVEARFGYMERPHVPRALLLVDRDLCEGEDRARREVELASLLFEKLGRPQEAFDAGADLLVIGRAVTQAPDPVVAASQLVESITL